MLERQSKYILEILSRSHRHDRGIRGRDNSAVEIGCGDVVDEEMMGYF